MVKFIRAAAFVLLLASLAQAQSPTVGTPDNLVVESVPAVPAAIADAVDRYTNARGANFVSWHPTRREMLSTRFADTRKFTRCWRRAGRARN